MHFSSLSCALHELTISLSLIWSSNVWRRMQIMILYTLEILFCHSLALRQKHSLEPPSQTLSIYVLPSMRGANSTHVHRYQLSLCSLRWSYSVIQQQTIQALRVTLTAGQIKSVAHCRFCQYKTWFSIVVYYGTEGTSYETFSGAGVLHTTHNCRHIPCEPLCTSYSLSK
jgi:hypothetical protein